MAAPPGLLPVAGARRNHVSEKSPPDGSGDPLPRDRRPAQTPVATTRTEVAASVAGGSDRTVRRADTTGGRPYRTSPLQRRKRPTRTELAALDAAVVQAVATETPVSVRGVFYRVVSTGAADKTEKGYGAVQRRVLELRRAGVVPYASITDGNRLRHKPNTWSSVDQMLDQAASSYRRALWNDQGAEVILISEKDAISGVVLPVTFELDVELCITRGYSSETFTHSIAQTVSYNHRRGKTTFVYQLGDHDPSGVDAWRSFGERVRAFATGAAVQFERIAVTPEQIVRWDLLTRPTKASDSRAAKFAGESVEVDAIPASTLRATVRAAVEQHIDPRALALTRAVEAEERDGLEALAGRWL